MPSSIAWDLIGRALMRTINDATTRQTTQVEVTEGELIDDVERMQNYGMTSVPPAGSDATLLFLGGDRAQGIVIAMENQTLRIKDLLNGEVAIYDDKGNVFKLGTNAVELVATQHVEVTAPTVRIVGAVTIQGNLQVNGNIANTGTLVNAGKDVGSTHHHVGSPGTAVPV